jgi:SAM-dependent methyltransferase
LGSPSEPERALSFDAVARDYERHRPDYPPEAVAWLAERLGVGSGTRVLDLGAGTGKLTRALVELGADVVAVEPGTKMLAELRAAVPGARGLLGSAESIPLPDGTVDVAAAGQAYHWFDPARALPELHRVLRGGGGLALLWNWWDLDDPTQKRLAALSGRARGDFASLPGEPWFAETGRTRIRSSWPLTTEGLVARFATSSAVITAPPGQRDRTLAEVREIARELGDEFHLSRLTHVFAFRRIDP